jgi:hypothetical protein
MTVTEIQTGPSFATRWLSRRVARDCHQRWMRALITVIRGTKGLAVRPRCIGTAWSLPFGAILLHSSLNVRETHFVWLRNFAIRHLSTISSKILASHHVTSKSPAPALLQFCSLLSAQSSPCPSLTKSHLLLSFDVFWSIINISILLQKCFEFHSFSVISYPWKQNKTLAEQMFLHLAKYRCSL